MNPVKATRLNFLGLPVGLLLWAWLAVAAMSLLGTASACKKEAANCFHVYLERDFPAIEAAVFRNHTRMVGRKSSGLLDGDFAFSGPSLESSCNNMKKVLDCFDHALAIGRCYYYDDFFQFRSLAETLWPVFNWFCTDTTRLRTRFLVLLRSWECFEEERTRSECENEARLPHNVWQRIMRLQEDQSICKDLKRQRDCLLGRQRIRQSCGEDGEILYRNASDIFFGNWCDATNFAGIPLHSQGSPHPRLSLSILCSVFLIRRVFVMLFLA